MAVHVAAQLQAANVQYYSSLGAGVAANTQWPMGFRTRILHWEGVRCVAVAVPWEDNITIKNRNIRFKAKPAANGAIHNVMCS